MYLNHNMGEIPVGVGMGLTLTWDVFKLIWELFQ